MRTMRCVIRSVALSFTLAASLFGQEAPKPTYHSGGNQPFPEASQKKLNDHADITTLGVNIDWMLASGLDVESYVEAIWRTGNAVKQDRIPGALIYADKLVGNTMPTGIGFLMTDPERHRVGHDSLYYVEDLTGGLLTMPLTLTAAMQGKLKLEEPIGKYLPSIAHLELGKVTIELVIRHQSGLPKHIPYKGKFKTRWEMLDFLAAQKLESKPGTKELKSPYNFTLLGMILEKVNDQPFSAHAEEAVLTYFGMANSYMGPFPDRRQLVAPGEYGEWLGRLSWAEPAEPFGWALYPDAGHTGLVTTADDTAQMLRGLLALANMQVEGTEPMTPMAQAILEPAKEGNTIGFGFERGRFGPRSFGWDALGGSSVWILPEEGGFFLYYSNPAHPKGLNGEEDAVRDEVLPLLAKSLGWGKAPEGGVDTGAGAPHPEPRQSPGTP